MKRKIGLLMMILAVLLCAAALADVKIDANSFPDAAFREYVREFDTDGNGKLSDAEIAKVDMIHCEDRGIANLKGIEHFTNLSELGCSANKLTSLDVSKNTALRYLDCAGNRITSLNLKNNPELYALGCDGNQLKSLDLSANTELYALYCDKNQLTSLDLSRNLSLYIISCTNNKLTSLNTGENNIPDWLCCEHNNLKEVDISHIEHLNELVNYREPTKENGVLIWTDEGGGIRFSVDEKTKVKTGIHIWNAEVSKIKDQVYTGKAIKPAVTLTYEGKKLTKGKDYTVSYQYNKQIGRATVLISGKGKFVGRNLVYFKILPKAVKLSSLTAGKKQLTVQWSKGKSITGYEIEYSKKKNFSNAKKVTLKKASLTKTVLKDLGTKTTYYVRIRTYKIVNHEYFYSAWSEVMSGKTK